MPIIDELPMIDEIQTKKMLHRYKTTQRKNDSLIALYKT